MNKWKKVLGVALAGVMCVSLASCSMVQINKERDAAQVVAEVNGAQVTKGQVDESTEAMLSMYGMTTDTFTQQYGADQLTSMRTSALQTLVQNEMLYQKAIEDGFVDESDENKAAIKAELEESLNSLKESIKSSVEADETVAEADRQAKIDEQMEQFVTMYGYDDMDQRVADRIKSDAISKETEKINGEVSYTEEQAKTFYDEQVAEQQPKVEEDPSSYATYSSSGIAVVNPADARYIKHILFQIPEDVQTEIKELRTNGDDAGADVKRDEALADIKDKADEALTRAKAGEDFDALLEELGEDSGMKSEPAKTEGYLVYKDSGMVSEFEEAALKLAEGEISGLVATDFGYHILKNVKDAGGVIPFDDIKETIMEKKLSEAQNTHLNEVYDQLSEQYNVKTYTDRL